MARQKTETITSVIAPLNRVVKTRSPQLEIYLGSRRMSFGETAARRALRENNVDASKAIRNHLYDLPLDLIAKGFITQDYHDNVMSTTQESVASKGNRFLSAVEGKVNSGNDAELGRKWLEAFVRILATFGESKVAQDIAKVYGGFQ